MTPQYITASEVRQICGGISDVSLWRWAKDDALNFPKPVRINNRKYYEKSDITDWLDAMRGEA